MRRCRQRGLGVDPWRSLATTASPSAGALTPAAEALAQLESVVHPIAETETVDLRAANGRILAETVISERAVPPHDNAAVDGYAVFFDDLDAAGDTRLPCTGRAAAGHPLGRQAVRGEAIRVFTGAPMPPGPDTVLMQEDCRADGDAVIVPPGIKRGANRRNAERISRPARPS